MLKKSNTYLIVGQSEFPMFLYVCLSPVSRRQVIKSQNLNLSSTPFTSVGGAWDITLACRREFTSLMARQVVLSVTLEVPRRPGPRLAAARTGRTIRSSFQIGCKLARGRPQPTAPQQ